GDPDNIHEAIELYREALALLAASHQNGGRSLNRLANAIHTKFEQQGDPKNIDEAIKLHREALALHGASHPERGIFLNHLALGVRIRFHRCGNPEDIDEAIELHREALALRTASHPHRDKSLHNLATGLQARGDLKDIDEAIELHREALVLRAPPHPDRAKSLSDLAYVVNTRFSQQGDPADIDEAMELSQEALALCTAPQPDRSMALCRLANTIQTRLEHQGDPKDIDGAIELYREALAIHVAPYPKRWVLLNCLANGVHTRFQQHSNPQDIDEAIELYREAVALHKAPYPGRSMSINYLAKALQARFEQRVDLKDIDEAIELHREALVLRAPPHPDRAKSLGNLAYAVTTRSAQQGDPADIDEAIELHQEALALRTAAHPDRGMSLKHLALAVHRRFEQKGDPKDIDEVIELNREALSLHLTPHPERGTSLNDLASGIKTRFIQRGNPQDIDEAIELYREALALHTVPHPARDMSLNNLANTLHIRFGQRGDQNDINEAIELSREAVALCTAHQLDKGMFLRTLAEVVRTRFQQCGNPQDIDEAIELHREALALHTAPHPDRGRSLNNLATAIHTRFGQRRDQNDIDEAIKLHREALSLYSATDPDRGQSLHELAICLATMYSNSKHSVYLDQACALFQQATMCMSSSPRTRFHLANSWASTADRYRHTSALSAYHAAVKFLPQHAALHLDFSSPQQILSTKQVTTLSSKAAACAVQHNEFSTAVEFLEASRSVFWTQALHRRTSLDDLGKIRPDLSATLTDISRQLEHASLRGTLQNLLIDDQQKIISIEAQANNYRHLHEQWEQAVKSVQMLDGFENFMQPKRMATLRHAAAGGPIVILTASPSTCFALIVTVSNEVQYLNLPQLDLPKVQYLSDLSCALSNRAFDFGTFVATAREYGNFSMDLLELPTRLKGGQEGYLNVDPDDVFRELLAYLWKNIVRPVFDALNLEKSSDPPRLWWCPTGRLAFFPLHAAGIYGPDIQDCALDYVVSSYTPTLTALLDPPPPHTIAPFKMTAVIQPNTPGCNPLPGAYHELEKIAERVPNQWLTTLVDTPVGTAQIHLPKSQLMHFACHGTQDLEHPLNSGLILTDGRLTVSEIIRQRKGDAAVDVQKSMSLAFLSACETAKGDRTVPDEAMHLAATLLFAGFCGIIATMWTMNDLDGPKIADTFYEHLFKNCDLSSDFPVHPDLTQAAKALHAAVGKLRGDSKIPFRRWVPFVHYGF
ncbi:CHAT domain-containing protein, partial [Mycena capillaripes]